VRFFRDTWGEDERGRLTADELVTRVGWTGLWIADEPLPVMHEYTPLTAGLFSIYDVINLYADADLRFRDAGYYRSSGPANPDA
jgi:hypothetical protein